MVINLFNRQVVDWKLSRYHDSELVVDALHHAMLSVRKTAKMIFHSDQGSIYGSQLFSQTVQNYGLAQSMTAVVIVERANGALVS
ncbi:DDE-type integrase/transposase/recombinase [Aggregatibacter actinomycetemcomitans]|nr:DDE-type integrase/transposase/recombinase [Aggregatibacter actinomycetemcomitans]